MRRLRDEYEELIGLDPGVRGLVDLLTPTVELAEKVLRILEEAEAALRRERTEVSDRTSDLGAGVLTLIASSSGDIEHRRSC